MDKNEDVFFFLVSKKVTSFVLFLPWTGAELTTAMTSTHSLPSLKRVAVCGGTHGNEMSGVFLARHWIRDPSELQRDTFHATPFLGNPHAVEKNMRYIERDLNRTFSAEFLK